MKVTITRDMNKAVFTWDDDCEACDYTALGFEDSEIQMLIDTKAYMGKKIDGYSVEFEL